MNRGYSALFDALNDAAEGVFKVVLSLYLIQCLIDVDFNTIVDLLEQVPDENHQIIFYVVKPFNLLLELQDVLFQRHQLILSCLEFLLELRQLYILSNEQAVELLGQLLKVFVLV